MKIQRIIWLFAFIFSVKAYALSIPAVAIGPTPVSFTDLSTKHRYQVSVSRVVTPKKMTGNPFRDSYLQAKCGDEVLDTDSRRIAPSDFGKQLNFALHFELSTDICPSLDFNVELQVNGVTIDSPTIEYSAVSDGETSTAYVARIRAELENHQQDLVYFHGELSKSAGNRKSLHCVIQTYEPDPSFDSIISELKASYLALFGTAYVSADYDCTLKTPLDAEIASCSSGSPRRGFCTFYTLYSQTLAWFDLGITQGRDQKARLRQTEVGKAQELDTVIAELDAAKTQSLEQIKAGAQ